ncbi:MAG TPA: TIGR04211 family SH3 domain-containing protein [Pseudomonadales bacterium]|nr:TIGR04211 family SH3 domain-containing protein [Pseudomonadales bacterium]
MTAARSSCSTAFARRTAEAHPPALGGVRRALRRALPWMLVAVSAVASAAAPAERWINDQLRVDMRSGPTFENRILDFLSSGTPVTVLQDGEDWIRVRAAGKEGWIQSQYTTSTPIAADRLKVAEAELTRLRRERETLTEQLVEVRSDAGRLSSTNAEATAELERVRAELEELRRTSASALETASELAALQDEARTMRADLEALRVENATLAVDNRNEGLKWGAAAVLLGGLLALLAFAFGGRRRRSEWA